MTASHLISRALAGETEPLPCAAEEGICCMSGYTEPTIPRKQLIANSFTDRDLMRRPDSDRIGVATWDALCHKWQRMSSWICDGKTFERLDRQGVRRYVIGGVSAKHWAAYATTSYKKHGALRAQVNTNGTHFWRFENTTVDCSDRAKLMDWWDRLNHYLRAGIVRSVLESGRCSPYAIKCAGVREAMEFDSWAASRWRSPMYQFLCYLLPSQEELKNENSDSTHEAKSATTGAADGELFQLIA